MTAIPPHLLNSPTLPGAGPTEEWLVERGSEMVSMLARMGFSWEVAEDAAQDAMIRAWEWHLAGKTAELRNHRAWLNAVAIKRAQTICRRQARYRPIEQAEQVMVPSDDLERSEEMDALRQAIADLPHHLRQVLIAHAVEGKKLQEVQREFGLSEGTVNARLYRARCMLRSALRSRGFEIREPKKQNALSASASA